MFLTAAADIPAEIFQGQTPSAAVQRIGAESNRSGSVFKKRLDRRSSTLCHCIRFTLPGRPGPRFLPISFLLPVPHPIKEVGFIHDPRTKFLSPRHRIYGSVCFSAFLSCPCVNQRNQELSEKERRTNRKQITRSRPVQGSNGKSKG